jgi:outer membrane protein TolC
MIINKKEFRPAMLLIAWLCSLPGALNAQGQPSLTLEACYSLAESNYPLVRQQALIERTKAYSIENAARGYWPQLAVAGQASYQSDVTTLPLSLPGIEAPQISKDQYKIYGEVTQTVLDNGVIRNQQRLIETATQTEAQRNAAELYHLRERINQLFFGILLIDARLVQADLVTADLQAGLAKVNASIANGAALKSSADVLKAQLLQTGQSRIELRANRMAYIRMLALFTGGAADSNTRMIPPESPVISSDIRRPELRIYDLQKISLGQQLQLLQSRSLPRLGLFFQAGAGRPALNFLDNEFRGYYIGGLRLSWNIGSYYTLHREKALLEASKEGVDVQRDIFLFNTRLGMQQYDAEMQKIRELIAADEQIVALRAHVKATAAAQLSNGVITPSDYLREVTNEDRAQQDMLLHRIQLLLASYNYQTTTGH